MFIAGDVQTEVRKIFRSTQNVRIAVAYWGEGAARSLGLRKTGKRQTIIVCDLFSGACNPDEIELMQELGVNVFHKDRLHAKVYLADKAAIVGSSNASANGLGFEGNDEEVTRNIEANYLVTNSSEIGKIERWFKDVAMKQAQPVTKPMLEIARRLWVKRRNTRHHFIQRPKRSFIDSLRTSPSQFKDIRIWMWVYNESYSRDTAKAVKDKQLELHDKEIDAYEITKNARIRQGDVIVDFYGEKGKANFEGLYKILDLEKIRRKKFDVIFCKKVFSLEGFAWTAKDARQLKKFVESAFKKQLTKRAVWIDKSIFQLANTLSKLDG